jgi:hypothetical protein
MCTNDGGRVGVCLVVELVQLVRRISLSHFAYLIINVDRPCHYLRRVIPRIVKVNIFAHADCQEHDAAASSLESTLSLQILSHHVMQCRNVREQSEKGNFIIV